MALCKGTTIKHKQDFRPKHRLKNSKEFSKVYKKGKRIYLKWATLILVPNSLGYPRLGISAGRKKLGKAVIRNKAKRRARELFRKHKELLGGYDIIMILKMPIVTLKWYEIENSYKQALISHRQNQNQ